MTDTWSIKLRVRPDHGVETVFTTMGIPAGEIEIQGCDDGNAAVLTVRQRDESGRFVTSAYHRRDRAEEALERAEELAGAVEDTGGEAAVTVTVTGEIPA
jgi:hypothetical protein